MDNDHGFEPRPIQPFVECTFMGQPLAIDLAKVLYVQERFGKHCAVYLIGDESLTIDQSAQEFAERALEARKEAVA